jgi:YVTN family beta-propeller protein
MDKKGLKRIGETAFVLTLLGSVTGAMAASGKIDVSKVPVVGNAMENVANATGNLVGNAMNTTGNAVKSGVGAITKGTKSATNSSNTAEETTEDYSIMRSPVEYSDDQFMSDDLYTSSVSAAPASDYTSITDVATDGSGNIYAADATGEKLYKLSSSGTLLKTYSTDDQVNGVCTNGNYVYLLKGGLAGDVVVLDTNLNKLATIAVGHTPNDMVVNGSTGYVVNRFSNTVSVINLNTNAVTKTINIEGREPNSLALANGKLYVACHMPDESMTSDTVASNVAVINTSTNNVEKTINLLNGSDGVKGICASPDGSTVYVSHVIGRYTYPTTQLDQGWINTNALSIIDTASGKLTTSVLLDEVELGAANPWGVTVSSDGSKLIVALSGVDEVMTIDIAAMKNKINAAKNGNGVCAFDEIPDYLPFLNDCRERISLSGKGARAVCAVSGKVYIGLYFDGNIDVLNTSNNSVSTYRFVSQPANDDVRQGEILFSDATLCYQKWQSCNSCHPDARVDGLNWDNMNDGLGNPKSAKSMLYSHRTPPVMSTGIRASADIAVRAGMKFIQFNTLAEEQMSQIDEYLKALVPIQSPYLNRDGSLTESAQRGKTLFEESGCTSCHPAPLYTDMKLHNAAATNDTTSWENRQMDTPSLVEVWRTGPWIFDGRFNSMEDTVRFYTKRLNLTDSQITDLSNFVMSIGNEGEKYGVERVITTKGDTTSLNSLEPGAELSFFTVRRQDKDAVNKAVIEVTFESAEGNIIKELTKTIENVAYNTAVQVDLGIKIPKDLDTGSKLTIKISDENGKPLASDYKLVY